MQTCECGCDLPAPIAKRTDAQKGWVQGKPLRFVNGHRGRTHGHAKPRTPTYRSWQAMIQRCCTHPKHVAWKHYGGRGITVCERWRFSFEAFLADMGERLEGTSLDRIDTDGNYESGNCRWATPKEQRANQREAA